MRMEPEERLLVEDFDEWLSEARPDGASLIEVGQILMSIFARIRFLQTFPELTASVKQILLWTEQSIQQGADEIDPDTRESRPRVLAEHWRDIEGGFEMAQQAAFQHITDEDIQKWLDESAE